MAHSNKSFGKRIWAGDASTVKEAAQKYRTDPEEELIPYAVALYSFRSIETYARELLSLRQELIKQVRLELELAPVALMHEQRADCADVLSTLLEWMTRRRELSDSDRHATHRAASAICAHGLKVAATWLPAGHHTWSLLKLTSARLYLDANDTRRAIGELVSAGQYAHMIRDPKQKVRVYAKLGFLWRVCARPRTGYAWGMRALFVPNVPLAVRKKTLAALLGIDR